MSDDIIKRAEAVLRWNPADERMYTAEDGEYVQFDDYAVLRARLESVESDLTYTNKRLEHAFDRSERQAQTIDALTAQLATARRDALEEALDAVWETDSVELAKYGIHKIMDRIRALIGETS
jgi:hypothetical protein